MTYRKVGMLAVLPWFRVIDQLQIAIWTHEISYDLVVLDL